MCCPSEALLDTAVETTRLTMKVARGPRCLPQARLEANVKWNGRQGNQGTPDERNQTAERKAPPQFLPDPRRRRASKSR